MLIKKFIYSHFSNLLHFTNSQKELEPIVENVSYQKKILKDKLSRKGKSIYDPKRR
jgi:hypothetical protein